MDALDYTDEQLAVLAREMPAIMRALRDGKDPELFHRLDDWCWHLPPCERGEECRNGEQNKAQRAAAEEEEQARNWHIRRDERNGRHTP
jgi:hypothetical protein